VVDAEERWVAVPDFFVQCIIVNTLGAKIKLKWLTARYQNLHTNLYL
jgi:hypothetical protein